jgi:hypothetical protein
MDAPDRDPDAAPVPGWDDSLRFAPRTAEPLRARRDRLLVGAGVVVLHVLIGWGVESLSAPRDVDAVEATQAITVDFIETLPPQVIRATRDPEPVHAPAMRALATRPAPSTPPPASSTAPPRDAPLRLYLPDGSLDLPEEVFEQIDQAATNKQFDFQLPNLEAGARLLDRPPVIAYETTRFDQYWEPPNETLLDEILRKAAEKTSKEIRIPIPGAPGRRLVCRVSLLAAGGTCGMERNGGNAVVSHGDPKTLDPTEAAECQAWWDRIVGAATQEQWRVTRKLYDAECLKPLEKVPVAPREPAPTERSPPEPSPAR